MTCGLKSRVARRIGLLGLVAVAITTLAGCTDRPLGPSGLADLSTAAPSTTATAAGDPGRGRPAAAYVDWLNALARRDAAAACARQAPEFTIELRYAAILQDRAELGDPCTGFEALLWEDPAFASEIVDISVTQVTAEDALLAVTLAPGTREPGRLQTVRMVYHRAQWRVSWTVDRTERGPGTADGPGRWVDAWCDLDPTMTRAAIIQEMGPPSGEYTVADGGEPQLWWALDQYDFRVYLDVDGSVLDLVGDYDALSEADRAVLTCPELR